MSNVIHFKHIFIDCRPDPCAHGTCHGSSHGYTCTCNPGYTGQHCMQGM